MWSDGKDLNMGQHFPNIMEYLPNVDNAIKIVSLLEKNIFQEVSLLQISKRINLDYKTVRKTTRQLLKLGILKKEIKGKAHFVSLDLNHFDVKTYLCFAAYYNRVTHFKKKNSLIFLLEEIKQLTLTDSCLVLFGSHVIHAHTKSSDVDLLLLTEDKNTITKIRSLLSSYNIKTDLNVVSFKYYQKALHSREFNLPNQVLEKHVVLYNPELYWQSTLGGLKSGNRY